MLIWVILNLWPIILHLDPVSSVRVLDFGSVIYAAPESLLTSVVLTNVTDVNLPDQFILCSSIKQNKIDGKVPFDLFGEDRSLGWLLASGKVPQESSSGRTYIQAVGPNFNSSQFFGSVTNINIFTSNKSQSLESMTSNPCDQGDVMAWSITGLEKTGINLKITEDYDVCSFKDTYDMVKPGLASWHEADHQCKVLGHMTQIDDATDITRMVSFVTENNIFCSGIWLPISDEVEEGEYLNTYTQELVAFLPWRKGQPNGDLQGNGSYWDLDASDQLCVSCALKTGKSFRLRGLCKGTHLGDDLFIDYEQ